MNSCLENLWEQYQCAELCVDLREIKGFYRHALTVLSMFNLSVLFWPSDISAVSKDSRMCVPICKTQLPSVAASCADIRAIRVAFRQVIKFQGVFFLVFSMTFPSDVMLVSHVYRFD